MLFFAHVFLFLHNLRQLLQRIENICYLFIDRIYYCIFFPISRIYIWYLAIWIYFVTFIIQWINKDKITTFEWFQIFWYLFFSKWKSFVITSSASSLIMISILSLFECITCCSLLSMEKIKLFVIVNWILQELNFLRLFMIYLKYGLISLRYSSTDSVLFLSSLLSYSI